MTVTEEQIATAVLTALNTALSPKKAYDLDEVPATRPNEYVEVTVSWMFGGAQQLDGSLSATGWRITTRAISQTSVSNARMLRSFVRSALEHVALTAGSSESTPVAFETEDPIGPDDGWYSGLTTWTTTV